MTPELNECKPCGQTSPTPMTRRCDADPLDRAAARDPDSRVRYVHLGPGRHQLIRTASATTLAGGYAEGPGFHIRWQDGPAGVGPDGRPRSLEGATVEAVAEAILARLEAFQETSFAHPANAIMIAGLRAGLQAQAWRSEERSARGALGTNLP